MGTLVNKYFDTNKTEAYMTEYSKLLEPKNFLLRETDEMFLNKYLEIFPNTLTMCLTLAASGKQKTVAKYILRKKMKQFI